MAGLSSLDNKIIDELKKHKRLKAKQIAKNIGVDKKIVNSALYSSLKSYCIQDGEYYWSLSQGNEKKSSAKIDDKKYTYYLEKNYAEELTKYLDECEADAVQSPHNLFIKPMVNGYVFSDEMIKAIIDWIVRHGVSLNSKEFFTNRTDALKGADLVAGILCFPVFYFAQGKRRVLDEKEIGMYKSIVLSARKKGWNTDVVLPNGRTVKDLVYMLLSHGHGELQPVYDALFVSPLSEPDSDSTGGYIEPEMKMLEEPNNEKEEKTVQQPSVDPLKKKEIPGDDDFFENVVVLLRSLAIDDTIDSSTISDKTPLGKNIRLRMAQYGCITIEEFLEKTGLKSGTITGDVAFVKNSEERKVNLDHPKLTEEIDGFSVRAFNRLRKYGVSTYNDLISIDLEAFRQFRGVGTGVFDEVLKRINEIRSSLEQEDGNEAEAAEEMVDLRAITQQISELYEGRSKEESIDKIFEHNPQFQQYYESLTIQAPSLFGCALIDHFKRIGLIVEPARNNEPFNGNTDIRLELKQVVDRLAEIYKTRKPEISVNEVFNNNPDFRKYHSSLSFNAKRLFGMTLDKLFRNLGIVGVADKPEETSQLSETSVEVQNESETTSKVNDVHNLPVNEPEENEDVPNTSEEPADNTNTVEDVLENREDGTSENDDEENRIIMLLSSIFRNQAVSLKKIEGTTLYRSLASVAERKNYSIEEYVKAKGFVVDDNAHEDFKLEFNRIY